MFGIEILDVMVGVITIYLIFSLACTAIVEAISGWFDVRSKNLEDMLKEFLAGESKDGKPFIEVFYAHPLIQALSKGEYGRPAYIPPELFSKIVTTILKGSAEPEGSHVDFVNALPDKVQTGATNRIKGLLSLLAEESADISAFKRSIEYHYDAAMDRAIGWYKRYTQVVALVVSSALVIGANVDTVSLVSSLSSNPEARQKMVELAQQRLDAVREVEKQVAPDKVEEAKNRTKQAGQELIAARSELSATGIRMGWVDEPKDLAEWASKMIGLMVSILAISLGAPFWFDMLNRFMQVRAAGKNPREGKK